jgi:SNF2 family DNA or RNA helicase
MLRREKKSVGLSLPPKKEILVYCPMTSKQHNMYLEYLNGTLEVMQRGKVRICAHAE